MQYGVGTFQVQLSFNQNKIFFSGDSLRTIPNITGSDEQQKKQFFMRDSATLSQTTLARMSKQSEKKKHSIKTYITSVSGAVLGEFPKSLHLKYGSM